MRTSVFQARRVFRASPVFALALVAALVCACEPSALDPAAHRSVSPSPREASAPPEPAPALPMNEAGTASDPALSADRPDPQIVEEGRDEMGEDPTDFAPRRDPRKAEKSNVGFAAVQVVEPADDDLNQPPRSYPQP